MREVCYGALAADQQPTLHPSLATAHATKICAYARTPLSCGWTECVRIVTVACACACVFFRGWLAIALLVNCGRFSCLCNILRGCGDDLKKRDTPAYSGRYAIDCHRSWMLCIGLQLIAERVGNGDSGSQLETTPLGTWPLCASLDQPEKSEQKCINIRKCIYMCSTY